VLQPKIADGTFYVVNSGEAVALQEQAELTREEMAQIIGQITTEWDFDTARNLAEANLTAASAEDKGDVFILAPNDGTARQRTPAPMPCRSRARFCMAEDRAVPLYSLFGTISQTSP
jgi:ABC-type xylose transport system substrate-binding protein